MASRPWPESSYLELQEGVATDNNAAEGEPAGAVPHLLLGIIDPGNCGFIAPEAIKVADPGSTLADGVLGEPAQEEVLLQPKPKDAPLHEFDR